MKYYITNFLVLVAFLVHSQTLVEIEKNQLVGENINSEWAKTRPYVIFVSIDGFRYDYAELYGAEHLLSLKKEGTSVSKMYPCFPSKTFPNHYSLATGMYPGHNGIVSNEFYSRSKDSWYNKKIRSTVEDGSWYGGIPIWSLAEQHGMLSASFFWVGSAAQIAGFKPNYTYPYDPSVPNKLRIDQVIKWLSYPDSLRPHLITAYFSLVDDAGHDYGPDHQKVKEAVLEIDQLIGQLVNKMDNCGLDVNIILVSDHGMTSINKGVVLSEIVDLGSSQVYYGIPTFIYNNDSAEIERMYKELMAREIVTVYKMSDLPPQYNYGCRDRVGDLVVITNPPSVIIEAPELVSGGSHGFDPKLDDMGALFVARGPAIKVGHLIKPFENIHVYPLMANILGLKIPKIDGDPNVLKPILK